MNRDYDFYNSTDALPALLGDLEKYGDEVTSRAGVTKELMHVGITLLRPTERELLVPGRKPNLAAQIAETAWVLAGRNDVEWLARYMPRAVDFSDDGKTWRGGYGPRMRKWAGRAGGTPDPIDQLAYIVDTLRSAPASRQAVINLWDPAVDTTPGKDLPCNDWLSFSSRHGKLDLHVAVRSNDVMWGWSGINAFEWSVLQEVVAGLLGLTVGSLHFSVTSFHLYDRHFKKAHEIVSAQPVDMTPPTPSPAFAGNMAARRLDEFDKLLQRWFAIEADIREGYATDETVEAFPEPMLQSWLRVLQWWWSGDDRYLEPLAGTRLERAARYSVTRPRNSIDNPSFVKDTTGWSSPVVVLKQGVPGVFYVPPMVDDRSSVPLPPFQLQPFADYVVNLHNEKHAAYGDSWKRRGEMLGIMANVARKLDRLGSGAETSDETQLDTAIDLFVYLAKYHVWLEDPAASNTPDAANELIRMIDGVAPCSDSPDDALVRTLNHCFDILERKIGEKAGSIARKALVQSMLMSAWDLATRRYYAGQDEYRGADHD